MNLMTIVYENIRARSYISVDGFMSENLYWIIFGYSFLL